MKPTPLPTPTPNAPTAKGTPDSQSNDVKLPPTDTAPDAATPLAAEPNSESEESDSQAAEAVTDTSVSGVAPDNVDDTDASPSTADSPPL